MIGHEYIAKVLADHEVEAVFGVAGDANLFIVMSLLDAPGVRYVRAMHEANAVMMAIGYSRAGGRVGVATTTHGPGLTNTFTALVEGVRSQTPIVLLAGDTDPDAPGHVQSINQLEFVTATGAGIEVVNQLEDFHEAFSRALWRAQVERRPIVVNYPSMFQRGAEVEPDTEFEPRWIEEQRVSPAAASVEEAVAMIVGAQRPIVLAGRGAIDAHDNLVALAEALGAPLATTVLASGLVNDQPHNLGIFGTLSHPVAAEVIAKADCVVAFGASLNPYTTDRGRLLAGKRVIQCDDDVLRFGRVPVCDVGVVGDAALTADAMISLLREVEHAPATSSCTEELRTDLAQRAWVGDFKDRSTDSFVDPRTLTVFLDEVLPPERVLAVDIGLFMVNALTLSVPDPRSLVTTQGFQSIGLGMGAGVGAAVAKPGQPTVVIVGDGGFMMGGLAEFHTAVRENLDVTVVIYNNAAYGAEHIQLFARQLPTTASLFSVPDLAEVARSLGGFGVRVSSPADFDTVKSAIQSDQRPLLIDVQIDPQVSSEVVL